MSPEDRRHEHDTLALPPEVIIVFASHCPNVRLVRQRVRSALARLGLPQRWVEWNTDSRDTPAFARGYGSPTVLVNGRDVAGGDVADGERCRLYLDDPGAPDRAPSVELISRALSGSPTAKESTDE